MHARVRELTDDLFKRDRHVRKNQPKRIDPKQENEALWQKLEELKESLDDMFEDDESDLDEDV